MSFWDIQIPSCALQIHQTPILIDCGDVLVQIMISKGNPERLTAFKDALHRVMMGSRGQALRPLTLNTMQVTIWRCIPLHAVYAFLLIWR